MFFINIPFTIIAIGLIIFFTNESYDSTISKRVDFAGVLLLSVALFLLTFGLLRGNDYGWSSGTIAILFLGAFISLMLFIVVEMKSTAPMIEFHLFREWTFTASSVVYLFSGFGIIATSLIFNFFLQNVLGDHPLQASFIVMMTSLTVIIAMPLGNVISARFGFRPVTFLGLVIMGIALLWLSTLTVDTSRLTMIMYMILFGAGFGFSCLSMVSAIKHLPEEKSGIGSGVSNAARQIGTCVAIALLVSILDLQISHAKVAIKQEITHTIKQLAVTPSVKQLALRDLDQITAHSGTKAQARYEHKMKDDLRHALTHSSDAPRPADQKLAGIYDGTRDMQKELHAYNKFMNDYVHGVDQTLFTMIRNDPMAKQIAKVYQKQLDLAISDEQVVKGTAKEQHHQQVIELTGMLRLYEAGTDPAVTNANQFAAKLQQIAHQDKNNANIVQAGQQLSAAGNKLEQGGTQLRVGVARGAQAEALQRTLKQVKDIKNDKIAGAFDRVFLIAGLILLISSVIGLFTDKSNGMKKGGEIPIDGILRNKI
ncbi:MFS transporter [Sporolactobacillus shoreicorticis]|nr:MFS transporter [Sporolactobacillus shoreicorticis]MCO7127691.1 MFS transporter [Sporolactobacillus shoreicorticis]